MNGEGGAGEASRLRGLFHDEGERGEGEMVGEMGSGGSVPSGVSVRRTQMDRTGGWGGEGEGGEGGFRGGRGGGWGCGMRAVTQRCNAAGGEARRDDVRRCMTGGKRGPLGRVQYSSVQ